MQKINKIIYQSNSLELAGRNLIITGNNGAGKTKFLYKLLNELENKKDDLNTEFMEKFNSILHDGVKNFDVALDLTKEEIEYLLKTNQNNAPNIKFKNWLMEVNNILKNKYEIFKNKRKIYLESSKNDIQVRNYQLNDNLFIKNFYYHHIHHVENFISQIDILINDFIIDHKLLIIQPSIQNEKIYYFDSSRVQSNIFTLSVDQDYASYKNNQQLYDVEDAFEAYLIQQRRHFNDLMNYRKSNIQPGSPISISIYDTNEIERWFLKIEEHLRIIFENNSIELSFTIKGDQVLIIQRDKNIYFSFDSLSSGFKAIFNIYANLLVRAQFGDIAPEELSGIAIIDEIDVHLHISLQKKVLPFLIKAFPKVQFIVSTHSPFVITSTDKNTVVYDISSGEFFEEDLSRYSYESVIKGLFHVEIQSEKLQSEIKAIAEILNNQPNSYEKLRNILKNITPFSKQLDVESKSFYVKALNHLLDNQELGDLDV